MQCVVLLDNLTLKFLLYTLRFLISWKINGKILAKLLIPKEMQTNSTGLVTVVSGMSAVPIGTLPYP